jgi:xanthine dehydrogenase accessory factor
MICSGKQSVIFRLLRPDDAGTVDSILNHLERRQPGLLTITHEDFAVGTPGNADSQGLEKVSESDFIYTERLGFVNDLYIIGGGHCALALSELMSKMEFRISLFDDRPELNTIQKNKFAHDVRIIDDYSSVGDYVSAGPASYVVVMTLGYVSDAVAIRSLIGKDLKYFGVLGSNAKMATMLRELVKEGVPREILDRIRTPIGLQINSRTPEEIAVSIAAEIISVKNAE